MKRMRLYRGATEEVSVYQDSDLLGNPFIECAKTMWRDRCQAYLDKNGDQGSCVLGAGITVEYLGPHCRTPKRRMIIPVWEVCRAQGSLVWEDSEKEILEYLRDHGIDAHYAAGNMD
jgi:hypothetical protein